MTDFGLAMGISGLDENVVPNPSYPSRGRVLEVMAIASVMGASKWTTSSFPR
jgi:hypothetical protein